MAAYVVESRRTDGGSSAAVASAAASVNTTATATAAPTAAGGGLEGGARGLVFTKSAVRTVTYGYMLQVTIRGERGVTRVVSLKEAARSKLTLSHHPHCPLPPPPVSFNTSPSQFESCCRNHPTGACCPKSGNVNGMFGTGGKLWRGAARVQVMLLSSPLSLLRASSPLPSYVHPPPFPLSAPRPPTGTHTCKPGCTCNPLSGTVAPPPIHHTTHPLPSRSLRHPS